MGSAYADKALALKPGFGRALLRKQFFWDERATFGDPAHSDEAFAKARALKVEREELTRRQRAGNDPDLVLGLQHDFESRPLRSKGPVAVTAGQARALEGGARFECASARLEPIQKPRTSGTPTVVLMRWTPPAEKTAWLPIDEAPPHERTHLVVDGKSYAALALLPDWPPPRGVPRSYMPLANFMPDGPGGRKLSANMGAYRLLFDLPASTVGPRTLHAIMEVPATGARYEVDCSLDGDRKQD